MRGIVFQRLFQMCDKNGQLKIIIDNLKQVITISKDWKMSVDERRELYRACAIALDRNQEYVAAFHVLAQFLKMFQKSQPSELAQW